MKMLQPQWKGEGSSLSIKLMEDQRYDELEFGQSMHY